MFKKMNEKPITIIYGINNETGAEDVPGFVYGGTVYLLDNVLRLHTMWFDMKDAPDYIHGVECSNVFNPLYIEIVDGGDAVNVYEEF